MISYLIYRWAWSLSDLAFFFIGGPEDFFKYRDKTDLICGIIALLIPILTALMLYTIYLNKRYIFVLRTKEDSNENPSILD